MVGSVGAATLGLPHLFFRPAGLSALACLGMVLLARSQRKRERTLQGAVDIGASRST